MYEFGPFRLDPSEQTLLRNDRVVSLTPKAFETLELLVQNSGHLIRKDELIDRVWHDTVVEESNLNVIIHTLRKALGDDPRESKYIETVAKRGYRFVAEVRTAPDPEETPSKIVAPIRVLPESQPLPLTQIAAPVFSFPYSAPRNHRRRFFV